MSDSETLLDLDFRSAPENFLAFVGNKWFMGISGLLVWWCATSQGKNGMPPAFPHFQSLPFFVTVFCLWALGNWLKRNYDERYQLDSRTQQLLLVRKIFGRTFRSRRADFAELHAVAMTGESYKPKDKPAVWSYALCLVTRSARVIRVSNFDTKPQVLRAERIAQNVGLLNHPLEFEGGRLRARRGPDQTIQLSYSQPNAMLKGLWDMSQGGILLIAMLALAVGCGFLFSP